MSDPIATPDPDPKEPRALPLVAASAGCIVVFALIALAAFAVWRLLGL